MWMLWLSALLAAEVQVTVQSPAVIAVDGAPLMMNPGQLQVTARDLGAGGHRVEARSLFGKVLATEDVDLAEGEQLRLVYKKKAFTEVGRGPAPAAAERPARKVDPAKGVQAIQEKIGAIHDAVTAPEPTAAPAPTPAPAPVQAVAPAPAPTASTTVSLAFTGLDPVMHGMLVAGQALPWDASRQAFVVTGLQPNTRYELALMLRGVSHLKNGFTTEAPGHMNCAVLMLNPLTYQFEDCVAAGPALEGGAAPAAAAPAGPVAIDAAGLAAWVQRVDDESFSSDQLAQVRAAAAKHHFLCRQVVQLVEPLDHSSDKVEAIEVLRPKVLDPENVGVIENALTFSSDKEAVRALFAE